MQFGEEFLSVVAIELTFYLRVSQIASFQHRGLYTFLILGKIQFTNNIKHARIFI